MMLREQDCALRRDSPATSFHGTVPARYYREHPIVDTIGLGSGLPSPESRTFTAGILPSVHSMPAALSASCLRLPPTPAAGAWATPHGCISVASQVERAPGSIWLRCGNTSNAALKELLIHKLPECIVRLADGDSIVELRQAPNSEPGVGAVSR